MQTNGEDHECARRPLREQLEAASAREEQARSAKEKADEQPRKQESRRVPHDVHVQKEKPHHTIHQILAPKENKYALRSLWPERGAMAIGGSLPAAACAPAMTAGALAATSPPIAFEAAVFCGKELS